MDKERIGFEIKQTAISAMLLAVGMALPFLTGQIPQIGRMLLPMHIPVLLCGLLCGWQYGGVTGFVMPLLRLMAFGMPPVTSAVPMAFELAAYGIVAGLMYRRSRWKCMAALYRALIFSMLAGRTVWGIASVLLFGIRGESFTWQMFLAGAFFGAVPGIILQLIFIPSLMLILHKTGIGMAHYHGQERAKERI